MLSLLTYHAGIHFADGTVPTRRGNRHPSIVPYETFATQDGHFNLAVGNDRIWRKFCAAVDLQTLTDDVRYATNPERVKNHGSLFVVLAKLFAANTTDHWIALLTGAGVPCGAIADVGEALNHEQNSARGMIVELPHPVAGNVRVGVRRQGPRCRGADYVRSTL